MSKSFDAVVLGAGPAGEVCAGRLAEAGWRVAIVECHLVGGECSYYACMPSKALLRPAGLLAEAHRVPGVPVAGEDRLDAAAILARRDEVVHDWDDSVQLPWLEERGIELFRGEARFAGEGEIVVGEQELRGRAGGRRRHRLRGGDAADRRPRLGPHLEQPRRDQRPGSAGEHGRARRRPGRQRAGASLGLAGDEGDAGRGRRAPALARGAVRRRGSGGGAARPLRGRRPARRPRRAGARRRRRHRRLAAGGRGGRGRGAPGRRRPLAAHGGRSTSMRPESRPTSTASWRPTTRMRVGGSERLYAIGDVNGRALFTHSGKYQAWVAAENLLGRPVEAVSEALGSPRVTFTDPQVAAVGQASTRRARPGSTRSRSTSPPTAPPAPASRARAPAASRAWSSTARGGRSSAPPSPASRPPTCCRRRRSRSSARCRWRGCATRSRPTRAAARSG